MSKYNDASFIMPQAPYVKSGEIEVLKPVSGGNLTVDRNSKARIIDVNGDDVEVLEDVPCFDYRGDYVEPIDNSSYSFNGGVGVNIEVPNGSYKDIGTNDYTISWWHKYDSLTTGTMLSCYDFSSTPGFDFNILDTDEFGFYVRDGGLAQIPNGSMKPSDYLGVMTHFTVRRLNGMHSYFVNGIESSSPVANSMNILNARNLYIGSLNAGSVSLDSSSNKVRFFNFGLPDSEILDLTNSLPIPNNYKGATNVSIGAGSLNIGETYVIEFVGTTDFTVAGASSNTVGEVFECTAIAPGSGTAFKAGNTLNLDKGKTDTIWYDLDHDIQGTVNSAVLNNSTDFGNNTYPLETCPSLLTQGQDITNRFQDSANPVNQTINGLTVGVPQTLSCKGGGVITIVENGGSLLGGAATEVYPFTFTPTHTSVDLTLSAGHTLEHVNFTDTLYAVNHILTPNGGISTRLKDEITGGGDVNTFNSLEGSFRVLISAISNVYESNSRISLSDGTLNNRVTIGYNLDENTIIITVVVGGVATYSFTYIYDDIRNFSEILFTYDNGSFKTYIDEDLKNSNVGLLFSENTLNSLQFNQGDGGGGFTGRTKYVECYNTIEQY